MVNINTYFKRDIDNLCDWVNLVKLTALSTHLSAYKNFDIYQLFGIAGVDFASCQINRSTKRNLEIAIGVDYDFGLSSVDSTKKSEHVPRAKFRPSFHWYFAGKAFSDKIPPELDQLYYYKCKLSLSYIYCNFLNKMREL